MTKEDYYKILGVPKTANATDIKKSYYQLAKQYHPDRNKDNKEAAEKFTAISEAYEVLGNEESRKQYDMGGKMGSDFSNFKSSHPDFNPRTQFSSFEEMFGSLFGNQGFDSMMGGQSGSAEYVLPLEFLEAAKGCSKTITLPEHQTCAICHGTGGKPGTPTVNCNACNGTGQTQQRSLFGSRPGVCAVCRGTGKVPRDQCTACNGKGTITRNTQTTVTIPAGIEDGALLGMQGSSSGQRGRGADNVLLRIQVKPSNEFVAKGADVYSKAAINMVDAALGCEVPVKLVDGSVIVKVPSGTQPGHKLRLRGKGLVSPRNHAKGDHYVELLVTVPRQLNAKQKAILQDFKKTL